MEIRESQSGAVVDLDDQEIIAKFNAEISKYNSAQVKLVNIYDSKQTKAVIDISKNITRTLVKDSIPEQLWEEIYEKLKVPEGLRGAKALTN
ncbi:hypothetical protein [Listeria booriae]|uniref:Uncharacterized protein n=1 Tax=Listeria booriae TaxID=1552123 RepID=A0A7X0TQX4_9LIST|nr:hypothetical protein [Listeria booriae]MBC1233694.1 hypothetical protein [Listeria booriae]MBC1245943.1 hypothetical protein [Listeria booriae]MBC1307383.1 hypothetical protein [Listeria booriae]MBC1331914.1 hypothetical protein [Listeria booriae]MBC2387691.1 hypothetical protein [Listeria booriae]